ncbi:hypothetical protein GCM10009681_19700 [Luedemannella helvata]|uniref:Uncharacterized protein n=1 Tax=Luedemannella helvata TaxID=349315 RepID=A0ABN2K700_9ACTN
MTPTYESRPIFGADYRKLTPEQRKRFLAAVAEMVDDLKNGRPFRPGLRVRRVQATSGVWEMTWAPDGRATWQYGREVHPGEPHIIWRRIGTHDVFRAP